MSPRPRACFAGYGLESSTALIGRHIAMRWPSTRRMFESRWRFSGLLVSLNHPNKVRYCETYPSHGQENAKDRTEARAQVDFPTGEKPASLGDLSFFAGSPKSNPTTPLTPHPQTTPQPHAAQVALQTPGRRFAAGRFEIAKTHRPRWGCFGSCWLSSQLSLLMRRANLLRRQRWGLQEWEKHQIASRIPRLIPSLG